MWVTSFAGVMLQPVKYKLSIFTGMLLDKKKYGEARNYFDLKLYILGTMRT